MVRLRYSPIPKCDHQWRLIQGTAQPRQCVRGYLRIFQVPTIGMPRVAQEGRTASARLLRWSQFQNANHYNCFPRGCQRHLGDGLQIMPAKRDSEWHEVASEFSRVSVRGPQSSKRALRRFLRANRKWYRHEFIVLSLIYRTKKYT